MSKISNIEGKVVFITGGSSGFGEAAARIFSERGSKEFLGTRRDPRRSVEYGLL